MTKEERREYYREYYKKNTEKRKESIKKYQMKRYHTEKLDYFVVYYIPDAHYCGVTNYPSQRMASHRTKNKFNTDGWRVLACADTKLEAIKLEMQYHVLLGMNGHTELTRAKNN